MDFQNNSGYPEAYNIIGNAGAIDRFPNVDCGSLCDCITGNANGDETINIFDIAYIINYLYVEGPSPIPYETCSADPNCDCLTNIFDVTYLINFLYREGSAPCSCNNWVNNCNWPPDKGAAGNSLNLRDINTDLDRQIDDAIPYR
jgi:hypothetical protein